MKHGPVIIDFLTRNQHTVHAIHMQGDSDRPGFLKITLKDGSEKRFDGWDEEDQGLFACALQGEKWDPSKRGIPSELTVASASAEISIYSDKKVEVMVNEKPLHEWGEKEPEPVTLSGEPFTIWKKKPVAESSARGAEQPAFCGMKKGFLG